MREADGSSLSTLSVPGLLLVACVFRPGLAVVGPLIPDIQHDLGLSASAASVLVLAPLTCFGIGAFLVPYLSRRAEIHRIMMVALTVLTLALALRVTGGVVTLLAGTVALGVAVAVMNVLLPNVVIAQFPSRVGVVTGAYSTMFTASAALAALLAVPVALAGPWGWRGSLLLWAPISAFAAFTWGRMRLAAPMPRTQFPGPRWIRSTASRPGVLAITLFMGLQSLTFYTVLAWLPSILQAAGWSPSGAGILLALGTSAGLAIAWWAPGLAVRSNREGAASVLLSVVTLVGLVGLLLVPELALLSVLLIGVGQAAVFPMALLFISRGIADPAARGPHLSAFAQGWGYLLAGLGPLLIGALHDLTGSWTWALLTLLGLTAAQAVAGGRAASVTDWARTMPRRQAQWGP